MPGMSTQRNRVRVPTAPRRTAWIMGAAALVLVTSAALVVARITRAGDSRPQLLVHDSVDAGFEALALATWDQFVDTFDARSHCFGDVTLKAAYVLGDRAVYDPNASTVTVHVPGSPAMLQGALVHEWAHHVEYQCREHAALRPAFIAALGLPPGTPWREDNLPKDISADLWAGIPSEQYAETAIVLVLGSRPIPTKAKVSEEAVRVLGEWARETELQVQAGE